MKHLHQTLGLPSRYDIAMESEEDLANATSISDTSVVMIGPLADAYTSALDQVYAKDAEGTGETGDPSLVVEPTGETGTNVPEGEDAPQPGQVIEPDEAGKTDEVSPVEGDANSAGTTVVPDDANDVPLNKEPLEGEEGSVAEVDEETQEEVKAIVLESQAQDAVLLQSLHSSIIPEAPADEEFETVYAVDETKVDADNVIEVTELLKNSENPENVTVLIDSEVAGATEVANVEAPDCNNDCRPVTPEGDVPEPEKTTPEGEDKPEGEDDDKEDKPEPSPLAASLESIVVSMGGKVVHSFKEYLASRKR